MNLSRALLIPLCCLGVAGCSSMANRGTNAPAPSMGPDMSAAAPPSVGPSTITVRPANLYNMGNTTRRGSSKPVSKSTPSKTSTAPRSEGALAKSEPAGEPVAKAAPAPASMDSTEADDAALMARPVRKGAAKAAPAVVDEKPASAPQSSVPSKLKGPKTAEVLPVSAPPAEEKLDSRLSS